MKQTELPDGELKTVLGTIRNTSGRIYDLEWDIRVFVKVARDLGASWAQIGEALGVTTQAAWERHRPPEARKIKPGQA